MHLAAWSCDLFLDFRPMKTFLTTSLLLLLAIAPIVAAASNHNAGTPGAAVQLLEEPPTAMNASNLPEEASMVPAELDNQPPGASALDLSLFAIISLGIIGLFWIRRHTAEL